MALETNFGKKFAIFFVIFMVHAIKTLSKNAQKVKEHLLQHSLLSHTHKTMFKNGYVYFPVTSKKNISRKYTVVSVQLPQVLKKEQNLKSKVSSQLNKNELQHLKTSFDHIGTIAILEVDP